MTPPLEAREGSTGPDSGLLGELRRAARAWRARRLLEGACIAALGAFVVVGAAVGVMEHLRFAPGIVGAARVVTYLLVGGLLLAFVVARVVRLPRPAAIARYLEGRDPGLDALLLTAAEAGAGDSPSPSPGLRRRLSEQAVRACREALVGPGSDAARVRSGRAVLAAVLLSAVAAVLLGPPSWRHGLGLLASSSGRGM